MTLGAVIVIPSVQQAYIIYLPEPDWESKYLKVTWCKAKTSSYAHAGSPMYGYIRLCTITHKARKRGPRANALGTKYCISLHYLILTIGVHEVSRCEALPAYFVALAGRLEIARGRGNIAATSTSCHSQPNARLLVWIQLRILNIIGHLRCGYKDHRHSGKLPKIPLIISQAGKI